MTTPNRPLAAALWMTGAIASFTAMAVATRQINGAHDTFEILAYRSVVGFVMVLAGAAIMGQLGRIRAQRLGGHLVRNICHFTGQSLWFWAITMIPLAQVFALEFTSPIWVILLAPLVLGERLTRRKLLAAALGFAGVWIVAQPDFVTLEPGVLAAIGAAFFFAATTLMTKALTKGEAVVGILFWLTLMQAGFGFAAVLADGTITLPGPATLPWLMLIGFCGVAAHLCLTSALALAPAASVVPIDFARLPLIAAIGAVFFGEAIEPTLFIGSALICAAIVINLRGGTSAPQAAPVTQL